MLCNFETTATEHACRLITAVSLHCKLSLALLLQSMAVSFYSHSYVNLELRKNKSRLILIMQSIIQSRLILNAVYHIIQQTAQWIGI